MHKMKSFTLSLMMIIIGGALHVNAQKVSRELSRFDKIKVVGKIDVSLVQGEKYDVKISSESWTFDQIITEVKAGVLTVKMRHLENRYEGQNIKILVTTKTISEAKATQGGRIFLDSGINGDKIVLECFSGGKIRALVHTKSVEMRINQGGNITINGTTNMVRAKVSTGGMIDAFDLKCKTAYAKINAGGTIRVSPSEILDAHVVSGGTVNYKTNPKVTKKISLGGKVEKVK